MRRLISILICIAYLNSTIVQADPIDDFEREVTEAIERYRRDINQLMALERFSLAPSQVKEGIVNGFALTQLGLKQHIDGINSDYVSMFIESQSLNASLEEVRKASTQLTLDGFQNLLAHKSAALLSASRMKALHANIQNRMQVIRSLVKSKDKMCERLSERMDPNHLPLESASIFVRRLNFSDYAGTDLNNFYAESPFARGYALVAGAVTFIAGVYLYSVAYPMTMYAAAKILFALGVNNAGVSVTGTGYGAVIIFAVVAVAIIVGRIAADHENEVVRERRERALTKLIKEIDSIQNGYRQNRLSKTEFQALGLKLCQEESLEVKPDGKPGMQYKKDKEWAELVTSLETTTGNLTGLYKDLDETERNLATLAKQQEDFLKAQVSAEIVSSMVKKSIDQHTVAGGWTLYNENMKPIWTRFTSFYAANMSDCLALLTEADLRTSEVLAAENLVKDSVKETGTLKVDLISQVDKSSKMIRDSIANRMASCL